MIYPIICSGYHFSMELKEDDIPTQAIGTTSDNCQGWEKTTYFKFNGDGKTVVWLCPDCAKRWNEEKQTRINAILEMATKVEYLSRQLSLYNELIVLGATEDQKWDFNTKIVETELYGGIKCL